MAKATPIVEEVIVKKQDITGYTLELSKREATVLNLLLRAVSGNTLNSLAKYTEQMRESLKEAGVPTMGYINGEYQHMWYKDVYENGTSFKDNSIHSLEKYGV